VTDWPVIWLGVIAISVAVMALIQIGVLIAIARLATQAARGVRELRSELRPLIEKIDKVADDARTMSGKAVAQVERLEALLGSTAARLDETLGAVHNVVTGPMRQGAGIVAALRALWTTFGRRPDRHRHSRDDEDALFVG
jgi:ABC-type transporter Mla subunit MlaD